MEKLFEEANYENDITVLVGLHDGRLVEESTIEFSERLINRLQFIAKAYNLHLSSLIDSYDDVMFNSQQCKNLILELDLISSTINDELLKNMISQIKNLAQACISKNNRRINLYFSGN